MRGVKVARMFLGAPDATGRQAPEEIPGAETLMNADLVIKALGLEPENLPERWDHPALDITRWGTIRTNFRTHATSLEGVKVYTLLGTLFTVRRWWSERSGTGAKPPKASWRTTWQAGRRAWRPRSGWPAIRRGTGTMAMIGADWARKHAAERDRVAWTGMYDPRTEHSSCGVGFVVRVDGEPCRNVFEPGIQTVQAVWHRGAAYADGKSGTAPASLSGCPTGSSRRGFRRTGHEPRDGELLAVGQVFLPRKPAGPSSNLKFCGWATTSTGGARFASTCPVSASAPMRPAWRSNGS